MDDYAAGVPPFRMSLLRGVAVVARTVSHPSAPALWENSASASGSCGPAGVRCVQGGAVWHGVKDSWLPALAAVAPCSASEGESDAHQGSASQESSTWSDTFTANTPTSFEASQTVSVTLCDTPSTGDAASPRQPAAAGFPPCPTSPSLASPIAQRACNVAAKRTLVPFSVHVGVDEVSRFHDISDTRSADAGSRGGNDSSRHDGSAAVQHGAGSGALSDAHWYRGVTPSPSTGMQSEDDVCCRSASSLHAPTSTPPSGCCTVATQRNACSGRGSCCSQHAGADNGGAVLLPRCAEWARPAVWSPPLAAAILPASASAIDTLPACADDASSGNESDGSSMQPLHALCTCAARSSNARCNHAAHAEHVDQPAWNTHAATDVVDTAVACPSRRLRLVVHTTSVSDAVQELAPATEADADMSTSPSASRNCAQVVPTNLTDTEASIPDNALLPEPAASIQCFLSLDKQRKLCLLMERQRRKTNMSRAAVASTVHVPNARLRNWVLNASHVLPTSATAHIVRWLVQTGFCLSNVAYALGVSSGELRRFLARHAASDEAHTASDTIPQPHAASPARLSPYRLHRGATSPASSPRPTATSCCTAAIISAAENEAATSPQPPRASPRVSPRASLRASPRASLRSSSRHKTDDKRAGKKREVGVAPFAAEAEAMIADHCARDAFVAMHPLVQEEVAPRVRRQDVIVSTWDVSDAEAPRIEFRAGTACSPVPTAVGIAPPRVPGLTDQEHAVRDELLRHVRLHHTVRMQVAAITGRSIRNYIVFDACNKSREDTPGQTHPNCLERLIALCGINANDVVVDLGSGDGVVACSLAAITGCRVYGVEKWRSRWENSCALRERVCAALEAQQREAALEAVEVECTPHACPAPDELPHLNLPQPDARARAPYPGPRAAPPLQLPAALAMLAAWPQEAVLRDCAVLPVATSTPRAAPAACGATSASAGRSGREAATWQPNVQQPSSQLSVLRPTARTWRVSGEPAAEFVFAAQLVLANPLHRAPPLGMRLCDRVELVDDDMLHALRRASSRLPHARVVFANNFDNRWDGSLQRRIFRLLSRLMPPGSILVSCTRFTTGRRNDGIIQDDVADGGVNTLHRARLFFEVAGGWLHEDIHRGIVWPPTPHDRPDDWVPYNAILSGDFDAQCDAVWRRGRLLPQHEALKYTVTQHALWRSMRSGVGVL